MDVEQQNRLINSVRIRQLLTRGDKSLQDIFRKRWIAYKKADWKKDDGKELVQLCATASPGVKDALTNGNIDTWDITTACCAITAVSKVIRSGGGSTNAKEDKAISLLRDCRNNFVHGSRSLATQSDKKQTFTENEYSNDEFNKKWNEIATNLVNLGDNHADIKKLKIELMGLGKQKVEVASRVVDGNTEDKQEQDEASCYETPTETIKGVSKKENTLGWSLTENSCINILCFYPRKKCVNLRYSFKDENVSEYESCESDAEATAEDKDESHLSKQEHAKCNACNDKTESLELKAKGDTLYKGKEYEKAIEAYTESIQLSGLQPEDQAQIFANRSAAHVMLNTKESYQLAKRDAEWAIQFWPSWWKGYFQLGKAQFKLEELNEAEISLNNAYALNPTSKDVRDELNAVKHKMGVISRADHLKPEHQLPTLDDNVKDLHNRLGISKKQVKKLTNKALNSSSADSVKARNYMLGTGGVQQNYTKAAQHYERAALNGDTQAMYNLAKLYEEGSGVRQDFDKSMEWLLKAVNTQSEHGRVGLGVAEAQHTIGFRYHQGIGVTKNYKRAVEWYEKAIQNGYKGSASNLGMMYKDGQGVERDPKRAFNLFKIAALDGDTQGMVNLASCYLIAEGTGSVTPTDEDIAEGKMWYKRAADKGNLQAAQELIIRENYTKEHAVLQSMGELMLAGVENKSNPLNKHEHKKEVKEAARKGSATAQRLVDIWKYLDIAMEAFKNNDSNGLVKAMAKAIRIESQIVEIPALFKSVIESKIKETPDDLDSVICYVHLNGQSPKFPEIIDKYFSKFKENEYFLEMRITSFIGMGKISEALALADHALQLYPKSVRFLYCRTIALFSFDNNNSEALEAVDAFLAAAPKDNDKIPACYYRKAMFYYNISNIKKFIENYEAGFAAERKQLPCFLPYDYPERHLMGRLCEYHKKQLQGNKRSKQSKTPFYHTLDEIKLNPERKFLLTRHRQMISQSGFNNISTAFGKSPEQADRPSLVSLKKITLKDMEPCEDKAYNGYVLEAKIIDWPLLMNNIVTVIEDENGGHQRLQINNWPSKGNKVLDVIETLKTFRPNTVISIINPHYRTPAEGKSAILVENSAHVRVDNSLAENKCCCCGKEAKVLPCSKCRMSRYCSKECQIFDWKEFNHNQECEQLKKYSEIISKVLV